MSRIVSSYALPSRIYILILDLGCSDTDWRCWDRTAARRLGELNRVDILVQVLMTPLIIT